MTDPISLIVGLANPGPQYANTRHNAGAWFVEQLASEYKVELRKEIKFKGLCGRLTLGDKECWLLIPTTYMNHSGQSVHALASFYKIAPASILVAHDELDFAPGVVRLKYAGGHGGHNGLRDIIAHMHTNEFHRLRVGIGHPGNRDEVTDYVLNPPSRQDQKLIVHALERVAGYTPDLVKGDVQKVMQDLHS